jgi:hypothetical protein
MYAIAVLPDKPRLIKPLARAGIRLEHAAITQVAREVGSGFLELEETYTKARSALTHLLLHEHYTTKVPELLGELIQLTRQLLSKPGVEQLSQDQNWTKKLSTATAGLEKFHREMITQSRISERDVGVFLRVVDANRELHLAQNYDPSEIVTPQLYTLAQMIARNFQAYDATLNGKPSH